MLPVRLKKTGQKMESKEKKQFSISKIIRWIGTGLSIGLFAYLLSLVDWQLIMHFIRQIQVWLLILVFICYLLSMVANGLRWYVLLRAQKVQVNFSEILKIVFAGAFISNFLPSTVGGDIVRIAYSYRFTKSAMISTASVLLERLIKMASMVSAAPFLFTLAKPGTGFHDLLNSHILSSLFLTNIFRKLAAWVEKRWKREFGTIKLALKIWIRQPIVILKAFSVAWISNLVAFLGMWLLAGALGIQVSFIQVIGVNFIVYFVTLLPLSINGIGLKEFSEISIYMYLGATLEQATIFTLLTRFITMAETFPGALWVSQAFNFSKMGEKMLADSVLTEIDEAS